MLQPYLTIIEWGAISLAYCTLGMSTIKYGFAANEIKEMRKTKATDEITKLLDTGLENAWTPFNVLFGNLGFKLARKVYEV